jgi:nucleoside-triphosphatase THEP1
MSRLAPPAPILALVYDDGRDADRRLAAIAATLAGRGLALAGFVQEERARPDRLRCDMTLVELAGGNRFAISQDRGRHARGCRLDLSGLLRALAVSRAALAAGPDLVIVNKFGKTEGEGGGLRPLIADALSRSIPVLVAVPWRNIESWRLFAGDFAAEMPIADFTPELLGLPGDARRAAGATASPAMDRTS